MRERRFVRVLGKDAAIHEELAYARRAGSASSISSIPATCRADAPRATAGMGGGSEAGCCDLSSPAADSFKSAGRRPAGRSTSRPTAHANGFPPKVAAVLARAKTPNVALPTTADRQDPAAERLAQHLRSGRTLRGRRRSVGRCGRGRTGSRRRRAACRLGAQLARRREVPSGGTMTPASPWIGSTRTATVSSSIAARSAVESPKGTRDEARA